MTAGTHKTNLFTSIPNHIWHWLESTAGKFEPSLLQGIALGAIAFAIPVLWDTANEIRTALNQSPDKHPKGILDKVYYSQIQRSFMVWIMLPSAAMAFLGLVIAPILPKPYNLIAEAIVIIWFLLLVWSVSFMKQRESRTIPEFARGHEMANKDYIELMSSLWSMKDFDIQEQLAVDVAEVFRIWVERVLGNINTINTQAVEEVLKEFNNNLENRSPLFMIKVQNLVRCLLSLHYAFWTKEQELENEGKKTSTDTRALESAFNYERLVREAERGLKLLLERYIDNKDTYEYFWALEKHADNLIKNVDYLAYLFESLGNDVFEQTSKNDDRLSIWSNFPKAWRVGNDKLRDKSEGSIIAKFWNQLYLNWSRSRIFRAHDDYDLALETVTTYLFPTYDPPYFAKFLTYITNPYPTSEERVDQMLNHGVSFGFASHSFGGSFGIGEDAFKELEKGFAVQVNQQETNAFEYFYDILNARTSITQRRVNDDIKQLAKRLEDKSIADDMSRRGNSWLAFLNKLKSQIQS